MLIFQLAALTFTAAVLCLTLKKDQPAFAFLVSVCAAAGVLAAVLHQAQPVLDWLDTWDGYFQGAGLGCLVRVLGIALAAQFAADTCREAGMAAAATAAELGGRILALLQALPLLQELLDCFAGYLQSLCSARCPLGPRACSKTPHSCWTVCPPCSRLRPGALPNFGRRRRISFLPTLANRCASACVRRGTYWFRAY